jgi:hypothetical protein
MIRLLPVGTNTIILGKLSTSRVWRLEEMERGLMWLPLLGLFIWLVRAGWKEYRTVEAYQVWAQGFDRAKYDIYAVLGQKGREMTWGKFTRQGLTDAKSLSLETIASIGLRVDDRLVDANSDALPQRGKSIVLEFIPVSGDKPIEIPFTEVALAAKWAQYLETLMH